MILQLQAQTTCFPAIKFKPYSIWDDVSIILTLFSFLILYAGSIYYLMLGLKLTINTMKNNLTQKK